MMTSIEIRETFLNYFKSKQHQIVPSAPMVVKDDPTLMFTNAGMNQFKDWFLGNETPKWKRVADTQKCLRVSGKHNDLEEVGHDTYHHTMFEMLGNWSFGDYFKKEAIAFSWELLTEIYKIDKSRIYVTVFGGDESEDLPYDTEAANEWRHLVEHDRILSGSKKDNFWEMGNVGPCGPCSEIHVDIRGDSERQKIDGKTLVNTDHPQVIEIWNLVFIQYNRQANGQLSSLPAKHVDTGMGFERLCMILQGKKSNYDTDVFTPLICKISELSAVPYGTSEKTDIATRVIADHVRAVSFAIADQQLPSNVKAGYVIRRILRRAVRYAYSHLNVHEPLMFKLVPTLVKTMGNTFPELNSQLDIIQKVIKEEEISFLRTLEHGMKKFYAYIETMGDKKIVSGEFAFEMYDTYGFPIDLTQLICKENNKNIEMAAFEKLLEEQKNRSRQDAEVTTSDWVEVSDTNTAAFVGYDTTEANVKIVKYRKANFKDKDIYQIVLDKTPFYAESGGQVGDKGLLVSEIESINIIDTKKENNLIVHISTTEPKNVNSNFVAKVDYEKRKQIENNHSATHLMHHVLRKVLGNHVEQKGSFVGAEYLRFDFSHYQKLSTEEISRVEKEVNKLIRENTQIVENRKISMTEAQEMGALAFFGEKYGSEVRVIKFGNSVELCGGTHVSATGNIGLFKIVSESAIAAGIRRIEAITAEKACEFVAEQENLLSKIKESLKNVSNPINAIENIKIQNNELKKELETFKLKEIQQVKNELIGNAIEKNGNTIIVSRLDFDNQTLKNLTLSLIKEKNKAVVVLAGVEKDKPSIAIGISDDLLQNRDFDARNIIKHLSPFINGGGGGQNSFANAGGKNPEGVDKVISEAKKLIDTLF